MFGRKKLLSQSDSQSWKIRWQSLVPPECRDVPITIDGETVIAFIQMGQFVMMLQDGLLMDQDFFYVCEFFQKAGYHVIWLIRCTQDISNGYLKQKRSTSERRKWLWRSPTTNFGRWTSDNFNATILLQNEPLPEGELSSCNSRILQRVTWAESDDSSKMIPGRTNFLTVDLPGSPSELLRWLQGTSLSKVKNSNSSDSM